MNGQMARTRLAISLVEPWLPCLPRPPQRPEMAQPVLPPGHAPGTEDRQGRHGPQTSGSSVLDVAQGMELRAVGKVRFARGTTRTSRWCAVDHRVIDWVSRSPFAGKFEVVIMIAVATEEMHGSD
jgi:hypothetical protein